MSDSKSVYDDLQNRSKKVANASDIKIKGDFDRYSNDETIKAGNYITFLRGKPVGPEFITKVLEKLIFTNPKRSLERARVVSIAETELFSKDGNGQYRYPKLVDAYQKASPETRAKAMTKFSGEGNLSRVLRDSFVLSKDKGGAGGSKYDSELKKVATNPGLSTGIDRYFEEDISDSTVHDGNARSIFVSQITRKYANLLDPNDKFKHGFQSGIKVGVKCLTPSDDEYIITATLKALSKENLALADPNELVIGFQISNLVYYKKEDVIVAGGAYEGQAGHSKGVATQYVEKEYNNYEKLVKDGVIPGTDVPLSAAFLDEAGVHLAAAKEQLENLRAADKIFFTKAGYYKDIDTLAIIKMAKTLGAGQILLIEEVQPSSGTFKSRVITMGVEYSALIYYPYEYSTANQGLKSKLGTNFKNNVVSYLEKIARSLAVFQFNIPRSPSMVTEAIMRAVAEALGPLMSAKENKNLLSILGKRGVKTKILATIKLPKPQRVDIEKLEPLILKEQENFRRIVREYIANAEKTSNRNNRKKRERRQSFKRMRSINAKKEIDYKSIVSQINAEIKDMIILDMTKPRLVNRTGRFAASATVTSASFDKIEFTFKKNPYNIFSKKDGRSPWNRAQRDPEALIRRSIRKLADSKYKDVFRPNTYIKGI